MAEFPTTRWTLILEAQADAGEQRDALEHLFGIYWRPLYVFARRRGASEQEAEDLVQGFLAHLLEKDVISTLDPQRGRLRGFLRTAFRNFMTNAYEKGVAQRRGGGKVLLDLQSVEHLLIDANVDPEAAFERAWAQSVFEHALERLQSEYASGQRKGPFEAIQAFFSQEPPSYAEAAKRFDMTVSALTSFLHRARTRFRQILEEEVADTVASPDATAEELTDLSALLS